MSVQYIRKFSIVILLLALFAMLAACGQGPDSKAKSDPTSSVQSPGSDNSKQTLPGNETMIYQTADGKVEIPKNPQRIVELSDSYVGHLLALGIKPVGITQHAMDNPYFKGRLDGVENLGDGKSIEKILELQPDLIITFSGDAAFTDELSKIAPTVTIEYGKLPVREQLLEFGKMTGREDRARAWIAEWDQKIAGYKPKIEAAVGDKTVSILQPYAKGIYAFGHNYGRGGEILYGEFKLKAPSPIQKEAIDNGKGWASLSLEVLPEYAGDFIFTSPWTGDDGDPDVVYGSSLWKKLPAVKNNRVFALVKDGSFFNDPVSLEGQLEFIVESLTGK